MSTSRVGSQFGKMYFHGRKPVVRVIDIGPDPPGLFRKYIWGRKGECTVHIALYILNVTHLYSAFLMRHCWSLCKHLALVITFPKGSGRSTYLQRVNTWKGQELELGGNWKGQELEQVGTGSARNWSWVVTGRARNWNEWELEGAGAGTGGKWKGQELEQMGTGRGRNWNEWELKEAGTGTGGNWKGQELEPVGTGRGRNWNRWEPEGAGTGTSGNWKKQELEPVGTGRGLDLDTDGIWHPVSFFKTLSVQCQFSSSPASSV